MIKNLLVLSLAAVLAGTSACGKNDETATPEAAAAAGSAGPKLLALPQPDLSRLAPGVARQIRERQVWQFRLDQRADLPQENRAAAMGELGNLYHAYGLEAEAEVCYRNANAMAPKEARWLSYLCQLQGRKSDPEAALELCREAAELDPASVASKVRLAELLAFQNQAAPAKQVFEAALALDPATAAAHFGLGQLALAAGDAATAANHFERVLELQPTATAVHLLAANAYRDLGDEAKAGAHLAKKGDGEVKLAEPLMAVVQGLSVGQQTFRQEAQAAFQAGRFEQAVEAYGRAVAADPLYSDLRVSLAAALLELDRPADALEQYELALKIDPNHPRASFGAGWLLQRAGQSWEAIDRYRTVLAAEPGNQTARLNLAQALFDTEQFEDALKEVDTLLVANPGDAATRLARFGVLVKLERYAEAATFLEESRARSPQDPLLAEAQARLLATVPDETVANGEQALALASALFQAAQTPQHAETLAMALARAGHFREAVDLQERLVASATEAGRSALSDALSANLERYRRGEAAAPPWDGPAQSPPSGNPAEGAGR